MFSKMCPDTLNILDITVVFLLCVVLKLDVTFMQAMLLCVLFFKYVRNAK